MRTDPIPAVAVRQALSTLGLDPAHTGRVVIEWTQIEAEQHAHDQRGRKVVQHSGQYAVATVVLPIVPDQGVSRGWRAA